jgi:two-component system, LytTR family, sensor kinase
LKSQFNPHFLFNTINSIFVLIRKNPDLASESLATFSDLLRYQLYECNENDIELAKELRFLEDFIQLEKLRIIEQYTDLAIEIDPTKCQGKTIAPFLLMPFIENSFKHVSKGKYQQNFIHLTLKTDDMHLFFTLENSVSQEPIYTHQDFETSGIGLKNVRRRLDLLYGNRYNLVIDEGGNRYKVSLTLTFGNIG